MASSFLKNNLADKAVFFYSPKIVGGDGKSMIGELGIKEIKDSIQLMNTNTTVLNSELIVEGYFN